MNTFPVLSTFLQPEALAALRVTRVAFLDDSAPTKKPIVSSVIDISAGARELAASDAAATAAASTKAPTPTAAAITPIPAPAITAAPTTVATATTPVTPTVTHINPPPTVVAPFGDAASFSKAQANSFATAQAVAAYYLMSGFGKETSGVDPSIAYLPPSALISPVNPVARVAALQLELHG